MLAKDASYAQSDLAVARMQDSSRSVINPRKLHELVKARKLTIDQFLDAVSVRKEPLKEFLSGQEIEAISSDIDAEPSLVTEFKPGIHVECQPLAEALVEAL